MHHLYYLNTSCNMPSPFPNAPLTRYWEPGVSWRVGEYCLVTYADRTGRQCATTFVCLVNHFSDNSNRPYNNTTFWRPCTFGR
ncbi:hypothetical protein CPB85DRAFT_1293543 [Mucidula mucida]|nr:hypothetical protein CPB85DRAFT_1293543 [Mucidula mucida]